MITQPDAPRILAVVQRALTESVLPALTDAQAIGSVHMIQHILSTLAVRAEHEIAWLVEEIDALGALGAQVLAGQPTAARVAAAVDALHAAPHGALTLSAIAHRYSLASEILSCAVEEVTDATRKAAVEAQLDARLAHELAIIGNFEIVGRT